MSALRDLRTQLGGEFLEALEAAWDAEKQYNAACGYEGSGHVVACYERFELAKHELCCAIQRAANPMGR